jgi:hypothetical protein
MLKEPEKSAFGLAKAPIIDDRKLVRIAMSGPTCKACGR